MKKQILGVAAASAFLTISIPAMAQSAQTTPLYLSQTNVGAIAQAFVTSMATGDFVEAQNYYDEAVQSTVLPETLQQNWQDLVAEAGAFQTCFTDESSRLDEPGTSAVVQVTCQFENDDRDIFVVFSDDGQVTQFSVGE